MACTFTLNGISVDCDTNLGGIVAAALFNKDSLTATENEDGCITVTEPSEYGSNNYLKFVSGSNSTLTSTVNIDQSNGTNYVETVAQLQFNVQNHEKAEAINQLLNGEFVLIVKDGNGEIHYLGYEEAVYISAGTGQTGSARTDGNYYQISFTDISSGYPPLISQSASENAWLITFLNNSRKY
jgi:hypothetical protein